MHDAHQCMPTMFCICALTLLYTHCPGKLGQLDPVWAPQDIFMLMSTSKHSQVWTISCCIMLSTKLLHHLAYRDAQHRLPCNSKARRAVPSSSAAQIQRQYQSQYRYQHQHQHQSASASVSVSVSIIIASMIIVTVLGAPISVFLV